MDFANVLARIRSSGVDLSLVDNRLRVSTSDTLTPRQRRFLRFYEAEIIRQIEFEQVKPDGKYLKVVN